jgi:GTP diphosphokinase / guanosine-3',5'-bis(diphosphate) 3'-diphosphatase
MKKVDTDAIIQDIIQRYEQYGKEDSGVIQRAYEYARKAHEKHTRKSWEPYIYHPVAVTQELMVIEPDSITIVAALLHDTVSDGSGTLPEIETLFWPEVRRIVEALDKVGMIKYRGNEQTIERLQRTLLAMAQDVRSIFVKFADRIDNLRTLQYHADPAKARRIADESLSIYAPIAARLGLYAFKEQMETLALRELDLDGYLRVTGELAHYTLEQEQFLTQSVTKIREILPPKYRESVSYRVKKPYSIYRKLRQYGVQSIREIYDVFALRIIVDDISDCYAILGIIHGHFTPLSERFKDYIAVPKPNGYQSLHTTVLWFDWYKQPIEIQIRTREMDQYAEQGTAAHILYKIHGDDMQRQDGYEDLVQMTMDTLLEQGSLMGQKITLPTLFVFSPKGDVFELPHRATPVDFAYAVHSNVGYHTVGARINGKISTLDTLLHDGDIVEIITSTSAHPTAQWLDFVVSSKARSQIGVETKRLSWDRAKIVEKGKKILFETFETAGIKLQDNLSNFSQYYGSVLDSKKQEEFYYQIGQWIRRATSFLPRRERVKKTEKRQTFSAPTSVMVGGEKNIPHTMAQCCRAHFPDGIIAVLRTGGRCMIHRSDCGALARVNPDRLLSAYWQTGEKGKVVSFSLLFHDVPGLLSRITQIIYDMGINIIDLALVAQDDGTTHLGVSIEVPDDDESLLERLMERIQLHIPEFLMRDDDFFDKRK